MGLRPESVGGLYPLTPVLIGKAWYVLNCHTGQYAGWPGLAGNYPRAWPTAEGAVGFAERVKANDVGAAGDLVWVPEEGVRQVPRAETLHKAAESREPKRIWPTTRFPTRSEKVEAVAEAAGFIGMPQTPADNYRILRAIEALLAGR